MHITTTTSSSSIFLNMQLIISVTSEVEEERKREEQYMEEIEVMMVVKFLGVYECVFLPLFTYFHSTVTREKNEEKKKKKKRKYRIWRLFSVYVYVRSCHYCFIIGISGEVKLFHSLD